MFPSFLCSQKPDCPLMPLLSLQPLKSGCVFSPRPRTIRLEDRLESSLLTATFCASSFLLPKPPSSEFHVKRLYHPLSLLLRISPCAITLHCMINVSSALLSYSHYYSILDSAQFQYLCGLSFQICWLLDDLSCSSKDPVLRPKPLTAM